MDPIMHEIDKALKRKGLSDAKASSLAVGNFSLIKNMRAQTEGNKRYSVQALQSLAEVLDLEFYFGPGRSVDVSPWGFSEAEWGAFTPAEKLDVFQNGFLPIPYHRENRIAGSAPIVFSKKYLKQLGVEPDNLSFVEAVSANGDHVLIDGATRFERSSDRQASAFVEASNIQLGYLSWPKDEILLVECINGQSPARVLVDSKIHTIRPLGRIIWSSRAWS